MSLNSHLQELRKKHERLDQAVEEAQRSPGVDGLEIAKLKKEKLAIKQKIESLGS